MNITPTPLDGFLLIEPRTFADDRGFFLETFQEERYLRAGIGGPYVQDNHSRSRRGVLRGLHFQIRRPQAKLVTIMRGRVFDVGVDLRRRSPTFGRWFGVELSDSGLRQVYVAPGFAHGFCVLSDWADLNYKVSTPYDPSDEGGLAWNDPDVGIQWPIEVPQLALRDATYPRLRDLGSSQLPYDGA